MTQKMHYGKMVDSETPITGVVGNNNVEWLHEEIDKGIDLDYQNFLDANPTQAEIDRYESYGSATDYLIGSWVKNDRGEYEPDKNGEYAAIVRESETQVVWSRNTKRVALCSPCFPGQGDLDTAGDYLAYDLPVDMYGDRDELEGQRVETLFLSQGGTISMTRDQARSGSHQGACDDDIKALLEDDSIKSQLDEIGADEIRLELADEGAWDDEQLKDDAANRERILWIACGSIREYIAHPEK